MGGPNVVLDSLLDILTPTGTLMMYVAWEDNTEDWYEWSPERQEKYLAECPAFDPRTSRAYRKWSILGEVLRTWPGVHRSANPGASMVAVSARVGWITADHPIFVWIFQRILLLGAGSFGCEIARFGSCLARYARAG